MLFSRPSFTTNSVSRAFHVPWCLLISPPFPGNASQPCACPAPFSRCGGGCLHVIEERLSYPAAEDRCAELGARLVVLGRPEVESCVLRLAAAHVEVWVGYRRLGTSNAFPSVDGCYVHNNFFTGFEPPWDCRFVYPSGHKAFAPCDSTTYSVCQLTNCHLSECEDEF